MKIINHSLNCLVVMLSLLAITFSSFANNNSWLGSALDTSLTCNDLVQISLDENCEVFVNADMILEGFNGDLNDFEIEVLDPTGLPLNMPVNGSSIGDTLYLIVVHLPTELSCWGKAVVEDKWAPTLSCSDHQISCIDNLFSVTSPIVSDNCDPGVQAIKLSESINNEGPCVDVIITQTFTAIDASGNHSDTCEQIISITPPALPTFPNDTIWSCTDYNSFPNIINAKKVTGSLFSTGSGIPDVAAGK